MLSLEIWMIAFEAMLICDLTVHVTKRSSTFSLYFQTSLKSSKLTGHFIFKVDRACTCLNNPFNVMLEATNPSCGLLKGSLTYLNWENATACGTPFRTYSGTFRKGLSKLLYFYCQRIA